MTQPVAFLGLGNMGTAMAMNLVKGHIPLFVYNRTKEKAEPLVAKGAQLLENPSEAFLKANIAISMVANDKALEELICANNGLLKSIKPGCIHISMSTISPETTQKLEAIHRAKGAFFVAAPVFGRPDAAAAAKLWICVAGDPKVKKQIDPILKLMGERVEDFGEDPKNANIVKLAGNFMILSAIESLGEAAALAENSGIDKQHLIKFFLETLFSCPVYRNYGTIIAKEAFEPAGFRLALGLKDINLIQAAAQTSTTNMPFANVLHALLEEGVEQGRGNQDWSAITLSAKSEKHPVK